MKLEHGKTYVTQGGWIVEIIVVSHDSTQHYFATQRTSVGNSKLYGMPVAEYTKKNYTEWAKHCGWQYRSDGSGIYQNLSGIDYNDLKIIGEYPFELKNPPKGYKWAGGFPRIEQPVDGKIYLTSEGRACKNALDTCWVDLPIIRKRRILLEEVEPNEQYYVPTEMYTGGQSKYFVKRGDSWYGWNIAHRQELIDGSPERFWANFIAEGKIKPCTKEVAMARVGVMTTHETYYLPSGIASSSKYFVKRDGKWFYYDGYSGQEILSAYGDEHWVKHVASSKITQCTKSQAMLAATPPVLTTNNVVSPPIPKEEKMNSSFVNTVKSATSRTLGAMNYLYVEPAKIIGGYVKRSVRYAVFFGTLTGIVYGVNDPTSLKKKVASCMPKITIEAPDALK